jgi:hypothetical protein
MSPTHRPRHEADDRDSFIFSSFDIDMPFSPWLLWQGVVTTTVDRMIA